MPRRIAVALAALAPGLAAAQPVTMPTLAEDVLSVETSAAVEHHSNIFALPDGPSDTVLRVSLGLRFERELSLQRVTADAAIEPVKFIDNSQYDNVGYRAGLKWDWQVGRPLFGEFIARTARFQTSFYDIDDGQDNQETVSLLRGLAGLRLTQSWALIAALDHRRVDNSLDTQQPSDSRVTGVEAGVRYRPGTGSEFDFVYRRAEGEYPNRQVRDALGNLLPVAVDNAYSQDSLLARLNYAPSDAMRVAGQVGYTRREFENLPQRDFSGPTAGLVFEWSVGGATRIRLDLVRTIVSDDALTSSYVDVQTVALRPSMQPTARITIDGLASFSRRSYEGDPGFVLSGGEIRRDRINEFGVRLNYEVARRVTAFAELRRVDRSSNYDTFEFTDNIAAIGIRALF